MTTDYRKQRGQAIAETCKIEKLHGVWYVPAQSGAGRYLVRLNPDLPASLVRAGRQLTARGSRLQTLTPLDTLAVPSGCFVSR